MAGAGFELNGAIVNGLVGEAPPPGVGFETDTFTVAAEANVLAAIATVTCVRLIKFVACVLPFSSTTDSGKNPDPFTFNINGAAPACTLTGAIEETVGTGKLTAKPIGLDGTTPLVTKSKAETASPNKVEGTTAVIVVLLARVALNMVGPLSVDCQVTVAFAAKFIPVKVSVRSGDPAVALVGEMEVIVAA